MRTTKTLTISLPPAMVREFEKIRKIHNFTRSELIRHALREYFYEKFPVYKPTKMELKNIEKGRREIKKGDFISLGQLTHELALKNRQKGSKSTRKISR